MTKSKKIVLAVILAIFSATGAITISIVSNVSSAYFIQKYELNK